MNDLEHSETLSSEAAEQSAANQPVGEQTVAGEQEEMRFPEPQPVAVEIFDQVYRLRGTDPEYLKRLAAIVDSRMRAVAAGGNTVDTLRVAVLASLNIADEMTRTQQHCDAVVGSVEEAEEYRRSRTGSLSNMLDEVLLDRAS